MDKVIEFAAKMDAEKGAAKAKGVVRSTDKRLAVRIGDFSSTAKSWSDNMKC